VNCLLCKGKMKKTKVAYGVDRKGYHLFIEKIPAYVCSRCRERYFEEKEVSAIQDMLKVFEDKLRAVKLSV